MPKFFAIIKWCTDWVTSKLDKKSFTQIKNVHVEQQLNNTIANNITGASFVLGNGSPVSLENSTIEQKFDPSKVRSSAGLDVEVKGTQALRMKGVNVNTPYGSVVISDDPNVEVWINKRD